MEALLVSTGIVALAEIGDKTQLLALLLAARYRRPLPIVAGIFVATVANHSFASAVGAWLTTVIGPVAMTWILGLSFIAMAGWLLVPDEVSADAVDHGRRSVFVATVIAFFLAEMGDKTQIATVALAARYNTIVSVVIGTTLGMMIANVPAVYLGDRAATALPVRLVHAVAAAIFAIIGLVVLYPALACLFSGESCAVTMLPPAQ